MILKLTNEEERCPECRFFALVYNHGESVCKKCGAVFSVDQGPEDIDAFNDDDSPVCAPHAEVTVNQLRGLLQNLDGNNIIYARDISGKRIPVSLFVTTRKGTPVGALFG